MDVGDFIAEWWGEEGGRERSNFPVFIGHLCEVLGTQPPGKAAASKLGSYEYEGPVPQGSFRSLKGRGSIDLYKRGHFILEAKQSYIKVAENTQAELALAESGPQAPSGARYDTLMRDARRQAENYAKNLPGDHPVAPFLVICDIGRGFELYVDTAGNGRGYEFFPDRQSYRIELPELASDKEVARTGKTALELLRAIWTDPKSIDPRFHAAYVTRQVATNLAEVSRYLEDGIRAKGLAEHEKNIEIEEASLFLMRVLFCMFSEDIGLLPRRSFQEFLKEAEGNDGYFANGLRDLFEKMNNPDPGSRFSMALKTDVRYFNGGLFEDSKTYKLGGFLVHNLYEAARQNWRRVEPAIFGTLLEQALDAEERAKLGAHYTPRPYVETLVRATIMDVLEPEWDEIEHLPAEEILPAAQAFHDKLASLRVLDPACGTGNFLYVAMELLQGLESKVIERILTLGGEARPRVGPQQFYGLELNPRAAKIAELVLWIGWLRNRLKDDPQDVPEPVLKRSANLNMGRKGRYDAVLQLTETGEPDYDNPLLADWPEAEFIVGNPPFIGGGKDMRKKLGDGYSEAIWKANPRVAPSADFVMQWWDRAAHALVSEGSPLLRFGFVTTNSITQKFSRRVIAQYLSSPLPDGEGDQAHGGAVSASARGEENPSAVYADPRVSRGEEASLSLVMAIADHPWYKKVKRHGENRFRSQSKSKDTDPAAVRIAMTVAERGMKDGCLREVVSESGLDTDSPKVVLADFRGRIWANLKSGIDLTQANTLRANSGLSVRGVEFHGDGYILTANQRSEWLVEAPHFFGKYVKPFTASPGFKKNATQGWVVDIYKVSEKHVRQTSPKLYEHLLQTAYPSRKNNSVPFRRDNWWRLALPHDDLRRSTACLNRYIATMVTAKHRMFAFVDGKVRPDQGLMVIASSDAYVLGTLQSHFHVQWSLSHGGTLEDRPRYNNTQIFDPFPFPDATDAQRAAIAELAEELDTTRKAAIAETDKLTMTELYTLLENIRSDEPLSDKDQRRATQARASIVNRLHEQLDQAVAEAYGWGEEWGAGALGPSEIVARLVALNHERADEEKQGTVRWLRREYQEPRFGEARKAGRNPKIGGT